MHLTEILKPECIKLPLEASNKQEAIYELTELLCRHCDIAAVEELKRAVWERELTRTTGIGNGLAIPHGKTPGCPTLCMAVGIPADPIDFGAIDGQPVKLIILLASPVDQTGPHIQALARISQMLTNEQARDGIMAAATPEEAYSLIEQHQPEA